MRRLVATVLLVGIAVPAMAHKASDAYLTLDQDATPPVLRTDVALRDLERAMRIDADDDGRVTWAELQARREALIGFVRGGVALRAGEVSCALAAPRMAVAEHSDGAYAVLAFRVRCPGGLSPDSMRYRLLFESDPLHRGLLAIETATGTTSVVFAPDSQVRSLDGTATSAWHTVLDYTTEGVWHIWIGADHLLFLAVLLLPAALVAGGSPGRITLQVVKVVTAFTVAHSITLGLAVLGYIELPSRWVEAAIAASIVLAAMANLHPRGRRIGWLLAFGFGLVHGLGFAGVLAGLALEGSSLAFALLGFNLGVELGQVAIVLAVLPLLILAARVHLYRSAVLPAGSLVAAAVGATWFLQRLG